MKSIIKLKIFNYKKGAEVYAKVASNQDISLALSVLQKGKKTKKNVVKTIKTLPIS